MSVMEIKEAVGKLSLPERVRLLAELCDWSEDEWDRQMRQDAGLGKFSGLNESALQAGKDGQLKSLEKGLAEE
ncbi:MAG: hypothetical protein NTZ01_04875 [Verrucomicrobia bacterium]|nr:hypothetical protein [Verrucomicrobiota bacterium]